MKALKNPALRLALLLLAGTLAAGLILAQGQSKGLRLQKRGAASADRRLALVIGNAAYRTAPLRNPVNDARAMTRTLRELGFEVIALENAPQSKMKRAIDEFGSRLRRQGGVGLFYFSGHGMQVRGRNYMIPLGATLSGEADVEYEAVDAGRVLAKLDIAGNRMNIVILDACRNNPFSRSFRSSSSGLATMDAPSGTLVAYATAPGKVAADGEGKNGLYTEKLIRYMQQPGLSLERVFKRVRTDVRRESGGKQVPWENTSVEGEFYFAGAPGAAVPGVSAPAAVRRLPAPAPSLDEEEEFWQVIKDSKNPAEFKSFLRQFPTGRFSAIARIHLKRMETPPPAPAGLIRPGKYTVQGTNPNGSTYSGTLTLTRTGDTHHLRWRIGAQAYQGSGLLKGRVLTVDWGARYPVIYRVMDNGVLKGSWANGKARENLTFVE